MNRAIIIALFNIYSEKNFKDIADLNNRWTPVNIGKYKKSEIFSRANDILQIYNFFIEIEYISSYSISIAPLSKTNERIIYADINSDNLQEVYNYSPLIEDRDFEILIEKKNHKVLTSLIEEYRNLWYKGDFLFQKGQFLSPEKQLNYVDEYMRKLKINCNSNIINLYRDKVGDSFLYDDYTEYNIDLLGVILYLSHSNNIEILDIKISNSPVFKIKIQEFINKRGVISIGTEITYHKDTKILKFYGKEIELKNSIKTHVFTRILIEQKIYGKYVDSDLICKEFIKIYQKGDKKLIGKDLLHDKIKQIYINVGKKHSNIKEIFQNIESNESGFMIK